MNRNRLKLREVLRDNLNALRAANPEGGEPEGQSALHRRSKVGQATIGRIISARGENARIETVEKLAKAYGLHPWQLLIPGMEPTKPPALAASAEALALIERLRSTLKEPPES